MFFTGEQREKRAAWLKTLKAGDVVAIVYSDFSGDDEYEKVTVRKVTPTGRVKVLRGQNETQFDSDGDRRVGSGYAVRHEYLAPWTEEVDKLLARRALVNTCLFYLDRDNIDREKVKAMPDEDLVKLRALLRTLKPDKTS